jgi:hypothetical protein
MAYFFISLSFSLHPFLAAARSLLLLATALLSCKVFNWHPIFMVGGMVVCTTEGRTQINH